MWPTDLYSRVPAKLGRMGHGLQLVILIVTARAVQRAWCAAGELGLNTPFTSLCLQGCHDDTGRAQVTALDTQE